MHKSVTSITELRKALKKSGIKVFVSIKVTQDDEVLVEVKKSSFLQGIKNWSDKDLTAENSNVFIDDIGDVII
ncbi:MAG: hypothetical protein ACYSWP_12075 [Planctomycetota bacterium]|jgi:hypothetical protein